ncbi:Tim44/TimA family putative adaptor protein [Sphingomonas sp.]|uniref:Tim44/TimA family putative adaptor protein n=1 Tax=Sphingomonas sp. TaxID=28214 RepID=UPI003B00F35C
MSVIIITACVALFVGLRLYSVLGRRTGHEQQPIANPADAPRTALVPAAAEPASGRTPADANAAAIDAGAVDGVRSIVSADPQFDVADFLEGARGAYAQVLDAFWKGDEAVLQRLCAPDVLAAFREAIAARTEAGEKVENRLIAIERAAVESAGVADKAAIVTVRFDADIAAATRDADGTLVAGSLSDATQAHDLWTFRRVLRSPDPNWLLIETDEAA